MASSLAAPAPLNHPTSNPSTRSSRLVPLAVVAYAAVISVIGFQSADPAIREAFEGSAGVILLGMHALLYGVIAVVTLAIVRFIDRFVYKLSCSDPQQVASGTAVTSWLVILALFCRIPALLSQHLLGSSVGVVALAIPAAAALIVSLRDANLRGAGKVLGHAAVVGYVLVDAAFLVAQNGPLA